MERDEDWILPAIVLAVATMIAAAIVSSITGYPSKPKGLTSLQVAIAVIVVAAFWRFIRYLWRLWRADVVHPLQRIRTDLGPALQSFLPIIIAVVVIGAFLSSITYLKSMIAAVSPFWADAPLAAMDRMIFVDPEAIAIALRPALPAIGLFYGLWHGAHLGGILWVIHWRGGKKSLFIISFMATWAIGMAFAYAFASAGPIFTGQYDISIAPESVRGPATFLWANYKASGALPGGGISAFPSMHVAIAAWFALILREKGLQWIGLTYLIGVFAGSIILGWHYVADGVGGIGVALLGHYFAGQWLSRRRPRTPPVVATAALPS